MKIPLIPIFSEDGGVGFDLLDVVNKVNDLVIAHNKNEPPCACNGLFTQWEIHTDERCYVSAESKERIDKLRA